MRTQPVECQYSDEATIIVGLCSRCTPNLGCNFLSCGPPSSILQVDQFQKQRVCTTAGAAREASQQRQALGARCRDKRCQLLAIRRDLSSPLPVALSDMRDHSRILGNSPVIRLIASQKLHLERGCSGFCVFSSSTGSLRRYFRSGPPPSLDLALPNDGIALANRSAELRAPSRIISRFLGKVLDDQHLDQV